jgi:PKD domain
MKTIVGSNARPLCRALFYTLYLSIFAFWAMPRSARAQIYVSEFGTNTVGEYDATTGAAINANFITGVINPEGLLLSGNTLFVSSSISGGGSVGTYNATTGAVINATFITSGVNTAGGLAISGNTVFITNNGDEISTYNATTGAPIDTSFISGLFYPFGLAISGNNLYVSQDYSANNWVGEYNSATGAVINPQLFLTNPDGAYGVALSGNHLFVAGYQQGTVSEYDATTGAVINANFISGILYPLGLAVAGNTLYVTQYIGDNPGVVSTYDATTGAVINANFITGLNGPRYIVVATPQGPIANAGPGQTVQAGTLVTLNGSASSDPSDQLPLTYAWSIVSQPTGSTATLSNPAIVNPTFTPDVLGNYVIQLVVTDAANLSSTPATVTISTSDAPPVANAGPNQTITATGTLVHLDGTQSYDLAGLAITYQWSFVSKPAGSHATLTGPATAKPSFTADVLGDYSIQLVVTDSLGTASSPSSVQVSFNDVAPIANAGSNQSALVGVAVTLNGSKSTDTDGEPLSYKWSLVSTPSGSKAAISNPTAQTASFVPDLPGTFVVQLIVNDGFLNSLPATAEIAVVSQQTSLIAQIEERQGVIATLPNDAFKFTGARALISLELNAVLLSIENHDYKVALVLLQTVILPQANGCATIGRPDNNDLITNCPDQSEFYPALLNIVAEVKALVPAGS